MRQNLAAGRRNVYGTDAVVDDSKVAALVSYIHGELDRLKAVSL